MPLVKDKIDLSIIIVSYKSKDHLAVLLPSIFASEDVGFVACPFMGDNGKDADKSARYTTEIIIVDNDSRDGTVEWLEEQVKSEKLKVTPQGVIPSAAEGSLTSVREGRNAAFNFQLIRNANVGFSAGNNFGIKNSSGKYILLLNPDTKLQPHTLQIMLDFMESRPDVGISGCKLIKGDGKLDLACRRRFPNLANSFKRLFLLNRTDYNYTDIDENQSMEVDSVVGAFLLIRRVGKSDTSENRISGASDFRLPTSDYLDEDFFMYGEDLDLCWRCKEAGYKVWYYPKAAAIHYKGESSSKEPFLMLKAFHDSMWIFYKKHYAANYQPPFNWLVWCGIYLRLAALVFINFFKSDPRVSK